MMSHVIIGTGSYLPDRVVTNHDIEAMVDDWVVQPNGPASVHEWAFAKHGAISRRHVSPGECTSDLATHAGRQALEDANLAASDVDLIVMASFSSDQRIPAAAGMVHANLRARAKFIQIDAACSGFVDALLVADGLLSSGAYRTALVIGADVVSVWNDPRRFMPQTIFGDGAGAVVLRSQPDPKEHGIRGIATGSAGELGYYAQIRGGGSKLPISEEVLRDRSHYIEYKFPLIQKWALEHFTRGAREAIDRAGIALSDVNWFVPHQPSTSMLREVARQLEFPFDKFVVTYEHTGNTSAGSIPIALDQANRAGKFSQGDWLVMPAAGTGLSWGAVAYRWHDYRAA
jgi:3-oxoacyl-[acyl-carrier-protein] synthase III